MPTKIPASLSPSQMDDFSDCRLRWWWKYAKGYTPIERSFHLDLGIGVHYALESYYRDGWDPVEAFQSWFTAERNKVDARMLEPGGVDITRAIEADLAVLEEAYKMGSSMLERYCEHYRREDFEVLFVEELWELEIPETDWVLRVKLDLLVRDLNRNGEIYVMDHKTFSRFNAGYLRKSHQFVAYAWVASHMIDEPIAGVIYNGLRKVGPRAKNAIYERHYIPVADKQIKLLLKRIKDMHFRLTQGKLAVFPEPGEMKCSYCAFKDPCEAYQVGEDYQFLLDNMFTKRGA